MYTFAVSKKIDNTALLAKYFGFIKSPATLARIIHG